MEYFIWLLRIILLSVLAYIKKKVVSLQKISSINFKTICKMKKVILGVSVLLMAFCFSTVNAQEVKKSEPKKVETKSCCSKEADAKKADCSKKAECSKADEAKKGCCGSAATAEKKSSCCGSEAKVDAKKKDCSKECAKGCSKEASKIEKK